MSKKERDLPKPKKTPFSRKRHENEGEGDVLMADRMAMAAAEGRLNEYLEEELPEGEYAKKLAAMMMGMTGILPAGGVQAGEEQTPPDAGQTAPAVPGDVAEAAKSGDAETLKELLAREQQRRTPGSTETGGKGEGPGQPQSSPSMMEKEMLEALIRVAYENKVSVDWLMARALKLYLEEYRKTGRL